MGEIMEKEFVLITKIKNLIKHTLTLTENKKRFPKAMRFSLVNRIQNTVYDILSYALECNELYPINQVELRQRQRYQDMIISRCNILLSYLDIAFSRECIGTKSLEYWSSLIVEIKNMTLGWKKKDKEVFRFSQS